MWAIKWNSAGSLEAFVSMVVALCKRSLIGQQPRYCLSFSSTLLQGLKSIGDTLDINCIIICLKSYWNLNEVFLTSHFSFTTSSGNRRVKSDNIICVSSKSELNFQSDSNLNVSEWQQKNYWISATCGPLTMELLISQWLLPTHTLLSIIR